MLDLIDGNQRGATGHGNGDDGMEAVLDTRRGDGRKLFSNKVTGKENGARCQHLGKLRMKS